MGEFRALLAVEMRAPFGVNRFLHTKDGKEKRRGRILLFAWLVLAVLGVFYVCSLAIALCELGLSDVLPAYLAVLSSLIVLAFGLFRAGGRIFGEHGYEILSSMPLKPRTIVLARFLALYLEDLLFTLLVTVTGVIVYGIYRQPSVGFYLSFFIGTLLLPAVPLVVSTVFGTLISFVASRMKCKSLVQTVLSVGVVLGVLLGSFSIEGATEGLTPEQISAMLGNLGAILGQIYPPALWLNYGVTGHVGYFFLYVGVSVGAMALALLLASKSFHAIVRGMRSYTAKHDYQLGEMASRGLLKTMLIREAKGYFSSSVYVTNTIIGPILGTVLAVSLCFVGLDGFQASLPSTISLPSALPFLFSAIFCMMPPASVSISMEGKHVWAVKSLPIPTKTWLDGKILFNLLLFLPFYLLSTVAMAIALKPTFLQALRIFLVPASVTLFCVNLGVAVNLKFHSFDWERAETVVKQSLPSFLGGFAGFFVSVACGVAVLTVPSSLQWLANLLVCLILLGLTAWLYVRNQRVNITQL